MQLSVSMSEKYFAYDSYIWKEDKIIINILQKEKKKKKKKKKKHIACKILIESKG